MITDKPFKDEVWLEVDAHRAAAAYAKGARDIRATMARISDAARCVYGNALRNEGYGPPPYRTLAELHVKRAENLAWQAEHMARPLSAGTGTARMPLSEVRAWMALEDGSTLAALLNPNAR